MKALRVLIVEDEAVVAMDIEERLTRMGYLPVGHAISGQEAIELAERLKPEVVLMDIRLNGEMDGIAAARELRRTLSAPVIFLTAFSEDETLQKAILVGPYGYIIKPIKDTDLKCSIEIAYYKHAADCENLRLNNLLDLLGQVNQAIIHGASREELFADVCRLSVERGAIATALICWLDPGAGKNATVAGFGRRGKFTDTAAFLDDHGPGLVVVKAMREGTSFICNDCGCDPCPYLPGLSEECSGTGSCGFFPLALKGRPRGALCIKAEHPGFFREREIALMEEIALDISFALDKLDADEGRKKAEEALQRSEFKYRAVVEKASDIILTVDRGGKVLFINRPPSPLTADQAIGADCLSFVVPEHRDLVRAEIARVFRSREPGRFEIRSRGPDESVSWYETRLSPPIENGPEESIVLITQDITVRKEAEEKLRLFKTVVDSSSEACAITDPSGVLVYVNEAHERLFGRTAEEAYRLNFRDYYPPDSVGILNSEVMPSLERGESWVGEMDVFAAGGRIIPLWERAGAIRDSGGKLLYAFGFMHDISDRRRAERVREANLRILQAESGCSLAELLRSTIDEAEALTGSQIGFFHFVESDQITISLQAWSTNTVSQLCKVKHGGSHYSAEQAGVWVDCLRERRPVIHNDYASLAHRKGLPEGHAPVIRELVVPVMHGDSIVAMLGVGNKPSDYDDQDIGMLTDLSALAWDMVGKKRIEEALQKSEETHRRLVENSHEIIFTVNPAAELTFVSPAWTRLLGHPLGQVLGRPVTDFIHPDDLERCLSFAGSVLESFERQPSIEYRVRHMDGSWRWHTLSAVPLRDATGAIVAAEGIASDITEQKLASEAQKEAETAIREKEAMELAAKEQRLLLDNIQIQVWYLTDDDTYGVVNAAHAAFFGLRQEELAFRNRYDIFPKATADLWHEGNSEVFATGKAQRSEEWLPHASGELKLLSILRSPILRADGSIQQVVCSAEDISGRRLAEDALKESNRKLEESFRQATDLAVHAQAATNAKSRFLANMSHEIRTPLNAILGFSQLLRQDSKLSPSQIQRVETINRNGEHLLSLLNDILDISKIEAGAQTLTLTNFDPRILFGDLVMSYREKASSKDLAFETEGIESLPKYLYTDEQRLRQVLMNLLGNAIKFTAAGHILLRAGIERAKPGRKEAWLVVQVEDTGPGLDEKELGHLFEAFEQTSAGQFSGQGTGLGLALSRQFARLLGGELSVISREGKGSIFRLEIPVAEGNAAPAAAELDFGGIITLEGGQEDRGILVVDDTDDSRNLLVQILGEAGFDVYEAGDGNRAVEVFTDKRPRIVLMDMRMPGMDSCEAIRTIRARAGTDRVGIIMITASATDENREKSLQAGADDFMAKPFRHSQLFEKIRIMTALRFVKSGTVPETSAVSAGTPAASKRVQGPLPEALKEQIREATICGRHDQMLELIRKAEGVDSELGRKLRELAMQFDYETIIQHIV